MFLCEALWGCLVCERRHINKVALPEWIACCLFSVSVKRFRASLKLVSCYLPLLRTRPPSSAQRNIQLLNRLIAASASARHTGTRLGKDTEQDAAYSTERFNLWYFETYSPNFTTAAYENATLFLKKTSILMVRTRVPALLSYRPELLRYISLIPWQSARGMLCHRITSSDNTDKRTLTNTDRGHSCIHTFTSAREHPVSILMKRVLACVCVSVCVWV